MRQLRIHHWGEEAGDLQSLVTTMVASSKNLRVTMLATPKLYIGVKLLWLVHRILFQIETVLW
jgi:hypothetical protein